MKRKKGLVSKTPLRRIKALKARSPLSSISPKMKTNLRAYSALRKAYLESHPMCEIYPDQIATDIHHTKGRGKYLLDTATWMAVCRDAHRKIHDNPKWAREHGYIR